MANRIKHKRLPVDADDMMAGASLYVQVKHMIAMARVYEILEEVDGYTHAKIAKEYPQIYSVMAHIQFYVGLAASMNDRKDAYALVAAMCLKELTHISIPKEDKDGC